MKKIGLIFYLLIFVNCTTKTTPETSAAVFPGCESVETSELENCFYAKLNQHISDNFEYPEIAQEYGITGTVYVEFIVDEDGDIIELQTRGPDKNLVKEARRIIMKLPKMTPAKIKGRTEKTEFSTRMTFNLED
jgi:periplasmic protein TonB